MYVSPFHGTDGTYELAVPVPGERLDIAVTLRTDDGARFSASLTGRRSTGPLRAAPAALRGSLLIRLHGIWLWLRRLPIRPRPRPPPGGRAMTTTANRVSANYWPGLDELPTGPRAAVSARIARRLFRAAVSRLDVSVVIGEETLGRGGPVAVIHRPEEFFARIGRDQLIGFGEAYLTGAWDAEDLGGFLTVLARRSSTWCRGACRSCARSWSPARRAGRRATPRTPRATSPTTTTCPTTCSSSSSTPR